MLVGLGVGRGEIGRAGVVECQAATGCREPHGRLRVVHTQVVIAGVRDGAKRGVGGSKAVCGGRDRTGQLDCLPKLRIGPATVRGHAGAIQVGIVRAVVGIEIYNFFHE